MFNPTFNLVFFTPSLHDVQCVDHGHYHTLIMGSNKWCTLSCYYLSSLLPTSPFKHFNRSLQACKHMPCNSHFCSCFLSCLSLSCLSLRIKNDAKVHILGHLCALTVCQGSYLDIPLDELGYLLDISYKTCHHNL